MAIMMVPMMMVHTIWEELKYGASRRLAPSSTAITATPEKNSVMYKNVLFFRMGRVLMVLLSPPRRTAGPGAGAELTIL